MFYIGFPVQYQYLFAFKLGIGRYGTKIYVAITPFSCMNFDSFDTFQSILTEKELKCRILV